MTKVPTINQATIDDWMARGWIWRFENLDNGMVRTYAEASGRAVDWKLEA